MGTFRLTVRHGPRVDRDEHESLEAAIAALRERAEAIRAEQDLDEIKAFRTYAPESRVKARLEISTGGLFRRRDAGVDVMGDGSLVPYRGGTFRRPLEAEGEEAYAAVGEALGGSRG